MLNRLSARERTWLAAAVIVLAIFAGEHFILQPVLELFDELERETAAAEKRLKKDYLTLSQKESVSSEYDKYVKYTRNTSSDDEEIADLLSSIENRASTLGLNVNRMERRAPSEHDFYKEYTLDVDVDCSMEALIKFLHESYSSPKLIRVSEITVSPAEKDSENMNISMVITRISVRGLSEAE